MSFLPVRNEVTPMVQPATRAWSESSPRQTPAEGLTSQADGGLPGFLAAVLSDKPEAAERQAEQQRLEDEQEQRHDRHHDFTPQMALAVAVPVGQPEADKRRTLSDALAIRRGAAAMASDGDASTSTPFWLEAGMRPAINRLCSVVLHAVGTAQLDLLRKCQASADQLQAHFRIPPWQSKSRLPASPPPVCTRQSR